ncbi:MAG TPA: N-acetylglucosamine-specific PTS transporter subunit IIBC [Allosphingosinicella sp.]|jgi:PTS system N-acetylglucosamine-specific IIC component|nr:N-acetylglucosamine-specific PTS transporter subunit IIBC [Allosphingosinicella sp.]
MARLSALSATKLQPLGRALMLPIAVLPIAGILLRIGQPDMLDVAFVAAAGQAIFANLGLLFAIGVAVGLARENHGAAGLAGVVAYLVTIEGAKVLLKVPPDALAAFPDKAARDLADAAWRTKELAKLSVPAGILSGLVSGWLYNRYANIKLPDYLAFFGGRRFVPIAAGFCGIAGAVIFGLGFPYLETAIDTLSRWVTVAGPFGLFLYGLLNRLLIVTGLHHILNNIAWFILGDFHGKTGDLNRFFAGDPKAGGFMAGFFPVMMFGLPAACLAMYRCALPERRKAVGGMLLSLALTSFLTGVTEPIEFSFMFLAPMLYLVHAVLTGIAMVVMDALGVKLGFGFSAGFFDYAINFTKATRPLLLIPVGAGYFAIYYFSFRFFILRFNLKTPGREPAAEAGGAVATVEGDRASGFIAALGGPANLKAVEACMTRLRLVLADTTTVDESGLRALGARGTLRLGEHDLQVVLGPIADAVAEEIRSRLRNGPAEPIASVPDLAATIRRALAGAAIRAAEGRGTRLILDLDDADDVNLAALDAPELRGATRAGPNTLHVLVGSNAEALAAQLLKPQG